MLCKRTYPNPPDAHLSSNRIEGRKTGSKNVVTKGTISKMLQPLKKWNLIEERKNPKRESEKQYRLTQDGLFALAILRAEIRE